MAALQAGIGSPEGQAAVADMANFASGGASVLMFEHHPRLIFSNGFAVADQCRYD